MPIHMHKENGKFYLVEQWMFDERFKNINSFVGVYAHPYKWDGDVIIFNSKSNDESTEFISNNFVEVEI